MKKQKQEKSEIDYLKKINNTLGGIYTVLVLLAIFITIAGVVSIEINKNVAAEAAEENLLRAPATISPSDEQLLLLDYSLNLEEGKSYKVKGTYGENNTAFEFTSIVVGNTPIEGALCLGVIDGVQIYDKVTLNLETSEPAVSENNCAITTVADQIPLTITSITIVEDASSGNLLKSPITVDSISSAPQITSFDYSLGFEIGKSYKVIGTYGSSNTPLEMTAEAYEMPDLGTPMLQWTILDANYGDTAIIVYDKAIMDIETGTITADDNKSLVGMMLANTAHAPLTITSITEYVEEQQVEAPQIIGNITNSFTGFLTGTGEGIVNFFEVVFSDGNGGISTLGIVGLSMMGLGLAVGIISVLMAKAKM